MSYYGRGDLSNFLRDSEEARKNWGWFLALGILLILLGIGVASSAYVSTIFSVFLLGFFLLSAGIVQIIQAFLARKWSGFFLSLLLGCLYLITGFLLATKPQAAAISLTLWIAALLLIAGVFRMVTSLLLRFEQWGWVFFNGLITFLLGLMIYSNWPLAGLWIIGLFLGIDLILSGWSWIWLALTARPAKES
jgi:uncharacterized membrane protein HdeD (DUF308 family)